MIGIEILCARLKSASVYAGQLCEPRKSFSGDGSIELFDWLDPDPIRSLGSGGGGGGNSDGDEWPFI